MCSLTCSYIVHGPRGPDSSLPDRPPHLVLQPGLNKQKVTPYTGQYKQKVTTYTGQYKQIVTSYTGQYKQKVTPYTGQYKQKVNLTQGNTNK